MARTMKMTLSCAALLVAAVTLSSCGEGIDDLLSRQDAPIAAERPDPDGRGVITYSTYQVMVARPGDTMQTMAARVGIGAAELANHNGLPMTYVPRPNEVLALPRNVGGSVTDNAWGPGTGWTPEIAVQAIDNAARTTPSAAPSNNPFSNGQNGSVIDPIRHRVEPGETAYSIARLYGVTVTALASWNGLGSDLSLRENQELLIPTAIGAERVAAATPLPPSASQPLPLNETIRTVPTPASPNLAATQTPAASRLLRPVEGPIAKAYSSAPGPGRNDGIDITASAGTPIKAAADGRVHRIMTTTNDRLGTILLVQHADGMFTVYGRIDGLAVKEGDTVKRGQTVGKVAAGNPAYFHFEVRQGTDSVDPMPYFNR